MGLARCSVVFVATGRGPSGVAAGATAMTNKRWILTLAGGGTAAAAAPAPAFYWAGWPGSNPTSRPQIVSTTERVEYHPPPSFQETPPTEELPPGGTEQPPDNPRGVPEPATITLAAVGLGAMA